jgi:conserved oligomeric Golgi complex subunit 6
MDQMAELEQTAFERIYRWTKSQCAAFQHVSPDIHPMFRTAVRALAERDMLLTYCLTEIQQIRSKVVHRCFIEALQRGGPR